MDKKSFDVTTLGELLIDFTENGSSSQGNPLLEANPGGAVCNVLAMLEKLGKKTAYIGKVGQDMFGTQLKEAVEEVAVSTTDKNEEVKEVKKSTRGRKKQEVKVSLEFKGSKLKIKKQSGKIEWDMSNI